MYKNEDTSNIMVLLSNRTKVATIYDVDPSSSVVERRYIEYSYDIDGRQRLSMYVCMHVMDNYSRQFP